MLAELNRLDPTDPREQAAIECNLELILRQQDALGEEIRNLQEGRSHGAPTTRCTCTDGYTAENCLAGVPIGTLLGRSDW